jgi:hypothetical protein
VLYAAWKLINRLCTSIFFFQHFSNICLKVKFYQRLIFPSESLLGIPLLYPQHKVLFLHIKYLPEFIFCTKQCACSIIILHNHLPFSYQLEISCQFSTHVVRVFKPYFWNGFINDLPEPFPPYLINSAGNWSCPVASPFFSLLIAIVVSTSLGCSTYTL